MTKKKQTWMVVAVVLLLIAIDQWTKIYVKTHFTLSEHVDVTSWFKLVFVENNGFAFGMQFGPKLLLTLFRIVASGAIIYYMVHLVRKGVKTGYLLTLAFVLAGAIGNIIDCMFYGLIFSKSEHAYLADAPASFVPFGDGYGSFLEGKVVDMFHFPLFEFDWPQWMPFVGGDHFLFFSPVFNFADACISCSIVVLLLFYRKTLMGSKDKTAS